MLKLHEHPAKRRVLLAGLAALAASAGLTATAQDAQAAFTLTACNGSDAVKNQGASFQAGAQAYWRTVFASSNGCNGARTLQSYNSNGSGNGLAAMGAGGGSSATPFINCSPSCGTANSGGGRTLPVGERDASTAFAATDDPPSTTQQAAINAGTASATDDGLVHVIPVATGSAVVLVHAPNGCDLSTVTSLTDGRDPDGAGPLTGDGTGDTPADKTQRIRLSNTLIEAAFAGDPSADTWGELAPGISGTPTVGGQNDALTCANVPVKRIVRQDNSGTTYAFKAFLSLINPSRGWLTTYAASPNTVWPANGSGTANPVPTGAGDPAPAGGAFCANAAANRLCSRNASGGGGLRDAVNASEGSIGYVDLVTARGGSGAFEMTPSASTQDYTFWTPIQNNPGGTATKFVEPTVDPLAHKPGVGARGANCADVAVANIPTPASSPNGDPTLGDWSKAFAAGGSGYSNCVLTYVLAWDDSAAVYGNSADEQAKARTVKDFLTTAVVSPAGQAFQNVDYSPLPNSIGTPLAKYAQDGVSAINWNKKADVVVVPPVQNPPAQQPAVQQPATQLPQVIPPAVKPSNAFSVGTGKVNSARTSLAYSAVKLPGAGRLTAAATYKSGSKTIKIATVNATVTGAGTVKLTVKLSSAARKVLAKKKKLAVTVKFTFSPTGGDAASKSSTVTVRAVAKKAKKAKKKK